MRGGGDGKRRGTCTNFVKFIGSFNASQCKVDDHVGLFSSGEPTLNKLFLGFTPGKKDHRALLTGSQPGISTNLAKLSDTCAHREGTSSISCKLKALAGVKMQSIVQKNRGYIQKKIGRKASVTRKSS